jgi:hypothetical protein
MCEKTNNKRKMNNRIIIKVKKYQVKDEYVWSLIIKVFKIEIIIFITYRPM